MADFIGFMHGMGIGGWLTNYKRFNVLPVERRFPLSIGDFEHFDTYITRRDIDYIASLGMDHIRLGFDQVVLEETPGVYRERIWALFDSFIEWCETAGVNIVLNLHKAIGNYCDIPEPLSLIDSPELQERFLNLWLAFENRYSDKPEIAFELLNEVRDIDPALWNSLAERTIAAIREKNPTRRIIVGSTCWNSPHALSFSRKPCTTTGKCRIRAGLNAIATSGAMSAEPPIPIRSLNASTRNISDMNSSLLSILPSSIRKKFSGAGNSARSVTAVSNTAKTSCAT